MPDSKFDLGDYIEVKDRIGKLYELFGTARIETEYTLTSEPDDKPKVICRAYVYRTPDDEHPATGHSWMYLPGTTSYTRGSELENTETSAVGRAIGMLGILIDKSIASANEVRNKADDDSPPDQVPHHEDGSLIGTAEVGKPPSDFELRETPDSAALSFRLANGRKSFKVVAIGPLAFAIAANREAIEGKRVTCWGHLSDERYTPKGTTKEITYKVLALTRLQVGDLILPVEEAAGDKAGVAGVTPAQEAEIDALPLFDETAA